MRKETIEVLVIEPNDQISDYQREIWMHGIVFRESKERGPELYSCRALPRNGARIGANGLALAQPPRETSRDSANNQAAQSPEMGKQGGCCQQHLVRAVGSPPRFLINLNEVVYIGPPYWDLEMKNPSGVIVTKNGLMYPIPEKDMKALFGEFI